VSSIASPPEVQFTPPPLPDCLWDKKVAYQCGSDTFVCNADEYFSALEVCDQQPVPEHGGMFDWKDVGGDRCHNKQVFTKDIDADCWCKSMQLGVSTSKGNSTQESFSPHVLCPNYEYVTSYVCYFPRLGGASYKVNRQLKDSTSGAFVETCMGFQSRNELPPVQMPIVVVYEAP
jgi:hypothetical protein